MSLKGIDIDPLITLKEVMAATKLGRSTLYRRVSCGDFPQPLKVGNASRWRISDVKKWMDMLTTSRDAG